MKWLTFIVFFINSVTYGQVAYKSLLTEYRYEPGNIPPHEWIDRDIYIDTDTITIITNGKLVTDIQKWKVNYWEQNIDTRSSNFVYHTSLINSPESTDLPAIFRVVENEEGQVEFIEWEIPPPEDVLNAAPFVARFFIDY